MSGCPDSAAPDAQVDDGVAELRALVQALQVRAGHLKAPPQRVRAPEREDGLAELHAMQAALVVELAARSKRVPQPRH